MSRTLELAAIEHGTVDGYRAGCHGSRTSCGATVSCAEVYTRYQGDWAFRKRVNAGENPLAVFAAEAAEVEAVRERDKAAAVAAKREAVLKHREKLRRERAGKSPKPKKERAPRRPVVFERLRDDVTRLHGEGLSDVAIARELGEAVSTIQYVRHQKLGLPRNLKPKASRGPSAREIRNQKVRDLHAEGATDREIGEALGVTMPAACQIRRRLGLPVNREDRSRWAEAIANRPTRRPEVARLHAEGMSDAQIATELGMSHSRVGEIRRALELPPIGARRSRWDGARLAGHGTNASYARGCRCTECHDAHREYHRAYVARRKAEGAREYHGTAYGYQLGCRARTACPGEVSCTDAMLAQERERRRAAGIPPKELVDAAPMQAHVADLVHAGMSIPQIAEAAGIPLAVLRKVVHSRGKDRGVVREVLAERAAAILAVPIPEEKAA